MAVVNVTQPYVLSCDSVVCRIGLTIAHMWHSVANLLKVITVITVLGASTSSTLYTSSIIINIFLMRQPCSVYGLRCYNPSLIVLSKCTYLHIYES